MRFPMMKLCVVLLVAVAAASGTSLTPQANAGSGIPGKFLEIMSKHFSDSLKYLYTSKQYDSQYMQRPGMAKYLMEASDFEWEQGLDFLKKYMQRQGTIANFRHNLNVLGKGELTFENGEDKFEKYFGTFTNLISDAETKFSQMNHQDLRNGFIVSFADLPLPR
ncbi:uncharacterized protein LOC119588771 [Penaeus monodon]|uniref:uncharacterized protein LOC119588771 n=1 Tax=Penaeus monodon TaxID=6687 RepID=UPI0018A74BFE|nr:uncharacterized protein LOC119588771 [Penaeus monodon]